MAHTRPNFLLILTDQLRADGLGCYGNPVVRTPNIDQLARTGVLLRNHFTNNPICMPSRATLFTGRYPSTHGVRCNGIPLRPEETTFTEYLLRSGYRTGCVGKIHLTPHGSPDQKDTVLKRMGLPEEKTAPYNGPFFESQHLWNKGQIPRFDGHYYGWQEVIPAFGHGDIGGYVHRTDLAKKHPGFTYSPPEQKGPYGLYWRSAIPKELHTSSWITDKTIEMIARYAADGHRHPFFITSSFPDPHHPFCAPSPFSDLYALAEIPKPFIEAGELDRLPPHFRKAVEEGLYTSGDTQAIPFSTLTEDDIAAIRSLYYGMTAHIDACVGRMLGCLDELGLRENTIVFFTSDHGELLGDHGLLLKGPFHYESLLKMPAIWSGPDYFRQGYEVRELTSHLDVAGTILELADISVPPRVQGASLRQLLAGEAQADDCPGVLIENDEDYVGLRVRTLRTSRHKITCYQGEEYGELFDLETDPHEYRNLWGDPAYAALKSRLMTMLTDKLMEACDPLPFKMTQA
ncbi:MAG: sulfatase-like hydrolase/transferase [Planctomycetes bacterium]|nr:sulfatase-like hydrolase/transferase [Planctomycetota bacterium]